MGIENKVKTAGVWRDVADYYCKVSGVWRTSNGVWVKEGGNWNQVWPAATPPPAGPPSGTYVLSPSSSYLPLNSVTGYGLFNTSFYQGYITGLKARISWGTLGASNTNVNGRASGTYYRNIAKNPDYLNRTIDHDISQGVAQFNAGSATGYTLTSLEEAFPGPTGIGNFARSVRLVIVV